MVIANPIYDVVFKRLMENKSAAKFLIETLIEESIEELDVKPMEFSKSVTNKEDEQVEARRILTVYRLDYIATIRTANGEHKKVLIEVQKAHHSVDVDRFRNYLGDQYKKEDEIHTPGGKKIVPLPIITIYLLGFRLPNIESPAVKVAKQYIDLITHLVIDKKSEFIEHLTHEAFFVQMPRIEGKLSTTLEKLLSVFEQKYFLSNNGSIKDYKYTIDDPAIKNIIDILYHTSADPAERQDIDDEIEAWRVIDNDLKNREKFLEEQLEIVEKELSKKDQALIEKDQALIEKDQALIEKDQALIEKEKAIEDQNSAMQQLLRKIEELKAKLKE